MKTLYNQDDVGRKAGWHYPLFKPLLTLVLLLIFGMNVNASPPPIVRNNLVGKSFCWDGVKKTTFGMDVAIPGKYYVLLHFKKNGTVEETSMVKPSTTAAFAFAENYGTADSCKGFYVAYVYENLSAYLFLQTANYSQAAILTGTRQTGEVWIFDQPTVQTLGFYGAAGSNFTLHGLSSDTAVFCKGSAGVTIDTTESSPFTAFIGSDPNDVLAFDHWKVTYQLYNDLSTVFTPKDGDGDSISWNNIPALPTMYSATATRGFYYLPDTLRCDSVIMSGKPIVMDTLADVKNINTGLCYLTIQEAIDDPLTLNTHTIWCLTPRDYVEDVTINKSLTVRPDPTSTAIGFYNIMGQVTISAPNVTIKKFDMVWSTQQMAFYVTEANALIDSIGFIFADYAGSGTGVFLVGSDNSIVSNCVISMNYQGIAFGAGSNNNQIINDTIEGDLSSGGNRAIYGTATWARIKGCFFNDYQTGVRLTNSYSTNDTIQGCQFENIKAGGSAIELKTNNATIFNNSFGLGTTAINNFGTTTFAKAYSNWYGSPTGPTIASNPCGTGAAIIENTGLVNYSPWYFSADTIGALDFAGITLNGNPPISVVDTPDSALSSITETPLVMSVAVTYPDGLSNYDNLVLNDARLISSQNFPVGSKILSLKVDGVEVLTAPYTLPNNDTLYVSSIYGGTDGLPLNSFNNSTHNWAVTFGGFDSPWSSQVIIQAVTYIDIDSLKFCKSVLGADTIALAFDTASMKVNPLSTDVTEVCTTVAPLQFSVQIVYPTIVNLDASILANAKITSDVAIPAGSQIWWGLGAVPDTSLTAPYVVPTAATELLLSTIVGSTAPLVGHSGLTNNWFFTIITDPGTYNITVDAIAQVAGSYLWTAADSNFKYESVNQQLIVHPLPTATLTLLSANHMCADRDSAQFSVALTGTAPWQITYTNGINDTTTVSSIATSPYTFYKQQDRNETWRVTNVTDAYCQNTPTDTVRVYVGTITYIGQPVSDTVCEGEEVIIPIKVLNFEDVGALSLTLNYDTAVLFYETFDNPNPSMFYFDMNPTATILKASGYGPINPVTGQLEPFNLPDSAILFNLHFTYKSGTNALVWDTINPAACEYVAASTFQPFCDQPAIRYYKDMTPSMTGHLRPKATVSGNDTICNGTGGSFTVALVGTAPWTFIYSDGSQNDTVTGISGTPYTVSVTPTTTTTYTPVSVVDFYGCNFWASDISGSAEVVVHDLPTWTDTVAKITCKDANNGYICVTVTGTGPFHYYWDNPSDNSNALPDAACISNLSPGLYFLTVEDANGCSDTSIYTVYEPAKLTAAVTSTNVTCYNTIDGTISVKNPTGGWSTQEVMITGRSWKSFDADTVLYTDLYYDSTYIVSLRDSVFTDCVVNIDTILISNVPQLTNIYGLVKSDITCNDADDGYISFNNGFVGGHGTYQVSIDSMATWSTVYPDSTTVEFDSLAAGTYDLYVRDAAYTNCYRSMGSITVVNPDTLSASNTVDDVTCFGGSNGAITVSASGGWGTYEYSINSNDGVSWQSSNIFSNLSVGSYVISVRDSANTGCYIVLAASTVSQPEILAATVSSTNITCNSLSDGTIDFTNASGGNLGNYQYSISNQVEWSGNSSYSDLPAGTYYAAMRDLNDTLCVMPLDTVTLTEPAPIVLTGTVKYFKGTGTAFPMDSVIVKVMEGTTVLFTDTTNVAGVYSFPHVCPGNYTLAVSSFRVIGLSRNPVNTTDVTRIGSWIVTQNNGISNAIPMVQFLAGDVKMEQVSPPIFNQLSTNDRDYLQSYFLNAYTLPWDSRPLWTFWTKDATDTISRIRLPWSPIITDPSFVMGSVLKTVDLWGLFTGDFDHSMPAFVVAGKEIGNTSVRLDVAQTRYIETGAEFELPILAGTTMDLSAVSLLMNFPSDKLEILGAYVGNNPEEQVMYNLIGDELRMSWWSLDKPVFRAGEKLFTLKLRLTSALAQGETIQLTLTNNYQNELADGNIKVLPNAQLFADKIASKPNGGSVITSEQMAFSNYPNPFNQTTTFVFNLPIDGVTTIEVFDMIGKKVNVVVNEFMAAGEHKVTINSNDLTAGVYTATLKVTNEGQSLNRTIKIIRNQ